MIQLNNLLPSEKDRPMDRGEQSIRLQAIVDSALCIGAGGSTGSLADKPIVRNAEGCLIIPGSHLKGRLRHECEKLARSLGWWVAQSPNAKDLCVEQLPAVFAQQGCYQVPDYPDYHCFISQIFGDPILPSRLIVEDLICPYDPDSVASLLRPGVSINRIRGTAEDSKLFFLETSPANAGLPFVGELHFLPGCPPYALGLIAAAFSHITALGGSKSAGLGWLTWQQRPIVSPSFDWNLLKAPSG